MNTDDLHQLQRLAHLYAEQVVPGHCKVELLIHQAGAGPARIPLPVIIRSSPTDDREIEESILEAASEYEGDEPLTGERLAKLAGYEPDGGHFRSAVRRLVKAEKLKNNRPGYTFLKF